MDRSPVKKFGDPRLSKHRKANFINSLRMMINLSLELVTNIPRLIKLRSHYKNHIKSDSPRVVIFSDNIDEINGIAINSRILVNHLRSAGKKINLIGTAFHDKDGGFWESNGTLLLPSRFSMEMPGYDENELAVPKMNLLLRYFKRFPVDIVELEVPGLGGWLVLLMCKFVRVKVISHYRTDVLGYTKLLVKSKLVNSWVYLFTKAFCRLTTPVIVPSEDFKTKMNVEMKLRDDQIVQLRRGINLSDFSPKQRQNNRWASLSGSNLTRATRFLFVGRISKEKELPFLEDIWKEARTKLDNIELCFVGNGPYLTELKKNFDGCPEVSFTGGLHGQDLSTMYAEADFFIFPSGTDTFGNVVVESLASGTPALVTNSGGPKMIIKNQITGWIVDWKNKEEWINAISKAEGTKRCSPRLYEAMRIKSFEHSEDYSIGAAGIEWWQFYQDLHTYPLQK